MVCACVCVYVYVYVCVCVCVCIYINIFIAKHHMLMFFVLSESMFTCHCISIEEEMAHGCVIATINGVLYNEVELSHLYGDQFM